MSVDLAGWIALLLSFFAGGFALGIVASMIKGASEK